MDVFVKFIKYIFDKIVGNFLWAIAILLGGTMMTYCSTLKFEFSFLEAILMVLLIVLLLGIVIYICYRMNEKNPNFSPIDSNFHVLKEDRIHEWINKTDYIHTRRYQLKALKSGVNCFDDKFKWTGISYELSGGESDDYKIELIEDNRNVFDLYRFNFVKPLR